MAVSPTHKDRATKVTAVSAWQRVAPKRQAMHQFACYRGDEPPPFRMQLHLSPTPRQHRIRRIPTIRLQTMKHIRGNCMRHWVWTQQCGKRGVDATPVRWRRGLTGLRDDAPISDPAPLVWRAPEGAAAVPVGGGGAWPGFETTRRAKLAARTASGRAAAHRHTQQPGPTAPGTPAALQATQAEPQIKHHTAQGRGPAGPRPLALQLRRERSEVRASGVAELAQLVDRGDPAAALAFGGEQVHAADR